MTYYTISVSIRDICMYAYCTLYKHVCSIRTYTYIYIYIYVCVYVCVSSEIYLEGRPTNQNKCGGKSGGTNT